MPAARTEFGAVRALHAEGLDDSRIAAALGWDRKTVGRARRRLGLPPAHDRAAAGRRVVRLAIEARLARMESDRRGLAARYGLPPDLRAVQVAVILALLDGPATSEALAGRCGRAAGGSYRPGFDRFRCSRPGVNNYLTDLRVRGLVARVPGLRGKGNGSGRGPGLYLLTAACLDLLAADPEGAPSS